MLTNLPPDIDEIREKARRALGSVKPADENTQADKEFLFNAKHTEAGRKLPEQHLVYFTLVDLLGFQDLGRFEKLAWSVPIDFNGRGFLIEHLKFGVGVFAADIPQDEDDAGKIVSHVHKAVKAARPFFDWLALQAVESSKVNVTNKSASLFDRYSFLRETYDHKAAEAAARKDERIVEEGKTADGGTWSSTSYPATRLRTEATWLGLAAIEAFFRWTEHVFIHIGIMRSMLRTAEDVARAAEADWATKYRLALDLADARSKSFYDELLVVRKELRNFVAHGSFGKRGEAFDFHSSAGAVPVLLPDPVGSRRFSFGENDAFNVFDVADALSSFGGSNMFNVAKALSSIDRFVDHVWADSRAPAKIYIQEYGLPLIMTMARDGTYDRAMASTESMTAFASNLAGRMDNAANMDW